MKAHWLSVLSITGIVLLAGNIFGSELRWKKAESSEIIESSVLYIPTVITTDDLPDPTGPVISLVQHLEPIQPPRVAPPSAAQLDLTYPELRPQSAPIPSGATLRAAPPVPLPPINAPARALPARGTEKEAPLCNDKITLKSIQDISHDIRPTQVGELPEECVLDSTPYYGRQFSQSCVHWKASGVCTKAAYFEDVQLERYGHTVVGPVLQPIVSGAKFFTTIPMLPYKMGVTPPNECVYTLGHYRAGNRSPYMVEPFPISARGALFQAGAVAGAVAVIP
jgi:hypothetical protein